MYPSSPWLVGRRCGPAGTLPYSLSVHVRVHGTRDRAWRDSWLGSRLMYETTHCGNLTVTQTCERETADLARSERDLPDVWK